MIWKKLQQTTIIEVYDADGQLIAKRMQLVYKPLLMWYDVVAALGVILVAATQLF